MDGKPDYAQLKKELPQLLAANPEIRERFPDLKRAELDKAFRFDKLTDEQRKRIEESFKDKK